MHNIRIEEYTSLCKPTHTQLSSRARRAASVVATVAILATMACSTEERLEGDGQGGTETLSETQQEVVSNRGVKSAYGEEALRS
jgi:hypothetical protein